MIVEWDMNSLPCNHRSNGLAETAVKNVRHFLQRDLEKHLVTSWSQWQNTPCSGRFCSVEMLSGRQSHGLFSAAQLKSTQMSFLSDRVFPGMRSLPLN